MLAGLHDEVARLPVRAQERQPAEGDAVPVTYKETSTGCCLSARSRWCLTPHLCRCHAMTRTPSPLKHAVRMFSARAICPSAVGSHRLHPDSGRAAHTCFLGCPKAHRRTMRTSQAMRSHMTTLSGATSSPLLCCPGISMSVNGCSCGTQGSRTLNTVGGGSMMGREVGEETPHGQESPRSPECSLLLVPCTISAQPPRLRQRRPCSTRTQGRAAHSGPLVDPKSPWHRY